LKNIVKKFGIKMKIIKEYIEFNNITEDKIMKFSEYKPTKYNGNELVITIMEWLRAKLLEEPNVDQITYSFDSFLEESGIDKNIFMTFYNEKEKTQRANNFNVEIDGNDIHFNQFKNEYIEDNK
jgi:hypothetical protein